MIQRTWHLPSAISVISRFLTKSIVFKKIILNVFRIKIANCIFEELSTLYLIVLLISFFPLLLWITAKNRTKLKKLFIWTTKSGEAQHHKHKTYTSQFSIQNSKCSWWVLWSGDAVDFLLKIIIRTWSYL